jgi:hypothetical protein
VRPERFELPACCSGGNRSIQLSYGRTDIYSLHGQGRGINVNIATRRVKEREHVGVTRKLHRACLGGCLTGGSGEIFLGLLLFSTGRAFRHNRRLGHRDLRGRVHHRLHRRRSAQFWDALR